MPKPKNKQYCIRLVVSYVDVSFSKMAPVQDPQRVVELSDQDGVDEVSSELNTALLHTMDDSDDANTNTNNSHARNVCGNVTELENLIQFSNVIDEMDKETYCIFHLYEPTISPQYRLMSEKSPPPSSRWSKH